MGLTLKDIAKLANVSESTVSRCLNDSSLVSHLTKERVKDIAKENNFQFNTNARNLAKKKSNKIGIIFPDGYYKFNMQHFFSKIQEYLIKFIEEKKYEPVIYTLSNQKKSMIDLINSKEVDGFLIATRDISEKDIEVIREKNIPYSFVYYKPYRVWGEMNLYTCDNVESGYIATKYLIENNCKKIITITSNNDKLKNYTERTLGYLKAMKEANLKIYKEYIIKDEMNFKLGERLAKEKKEFFKKIDGIFCQQDKVALGLMKGLIDEGFVIPGDISVIGHDDMEIIDYFTPKLTSIKQPFENICKNSVYSLVSIIEKKPKLYRKIFKTTIVERESVRT